MESAEERTPDGVTHTATTSFLIFGHVNESTVTFSDEILIFLRLTECIPPGVDKQVAISRQWCPLLNTAARQLRVDKLCREQRWVTAPGVVPCSGENE